MDKFSLYARKVDDDDIRIALRTIPYVTCVELHEININKSRFEILVACIIDNKISELTYGDIVITDMIESDTDDGKVDALLRIINTGYIKDLTYDSDMTDIDAVCVARAINNSNITTLYVTEYLYDEEAEILLQNNRITKFVCTGRTTEEEYASIDKIIQKAESNVMRIKNISKKCITVLSCKTQTFNIHNLNQITSSNDMLRFIAKYVWYYRFFFI